MQNLIYKLTIIAFAVLFSVSITLAGEINGIVSDQSGAPLGGVNIMVVGTGFGSGSDRNGRFKISSLPSGTYQVEATFVGYHTESTQVEVKEGTTVSVEFILKFDPVTLQEVMIKADRQRLSVSVDEPVRVEKISGEEIRRNSTDGGVLSALSNQTGLNTRPCALCGSAGIGMQGLDASYTEIKVDGMPIVSGVGSLYGMDGVTVNNLSEVNLTKGGSSAESSAGAMAGSVDLVTGNPSANRKVRIKLSGSQTFRHSLGANMGGDFLGSPTSVSLDYGAEPNRLDYNDDQLTDAPQYQRMNLFVTNSATLGDGSLKTRLRYYTENRFAGDVDWETSDRGSSSVYGRDIDTRRGELSLRWAKETSSDGEISLESAAVFHAQDSWYGITEFDASQKLNYNRLSYSRKWNAEHKSLAQGFFTYEEYEDNLNLLSVTDRIDKIPGIMYQHSWTPGSFWVSEGGVRLEHFDGTGLVPTLRGSVLYKPDYRWNLRLTTGTGFRPVTIYSLDKAVHAGFDNVSVPESLEPERSWNTTLSAAFLRVKESSYLQLEMSLFYTRFTNKAVLAYGHNHGSTVYSNADDAYSRGVEANAAAGIGPELLFKVSGTLSEVRYKQESEWHDVQMQNVWTARGSVEKTWTDNRLTANLSASLYGPQYLPENRGRDKSPVISIIDLGLRKKIASVDVTFDVKNLTDWVQGDNPFLLSEDGSRRVIDSAMIYGPLLGRTFNLGAAYTFDLTAN